MYLLIILLVTRPLLGQGNKISPTKRVGFQGNLEIIVKDNQLVLGMDDSLFGKEMLIAVHSKGYKHVKWKQQKGNILLEVHKVESSSGTLIPQNPDTDIQQEILGIFPILENMGSHSRYFDASLLLFQNPWM
ncbi:MAG: hypothetical protein WA749_04105, partial [Gelidibacter sp.]